MQGSIAAKQASAAALQAQIAADSAQIAQTSGGLEAAQARLARLQSEASCERGAAADGAAADLIAARDRLVDLENRLQAASHALADNLVGTYEGDQPDALTVVLAPHGFADLLERLAFLQAMGEQDAHVVSDTREARIAVTREAINLGRLEIRDQRIARQLVAQRDQAGELQAALLHAEILQVATAPTTRRR